MRRAILLLGMTVLGVVLGGCGRRVEVIDAQGQPVFGAGVQVIGLSITGDMYATDAHGQARAPSVINECEIQVTAGGYRSVRVQLPTIFPLRVQLQALPGSPTQPGPLGSASATAATP